MKNPFILVCEPIAVNLNHKEPELQDASPHRDYMEIAKKLNADLLGYDLSGAAWYRWARQLQKAMKIDLVESFFAASRSSNHDVILSMSEKVGIPLAATLSVTGQNLPHVMIGHKLSSSLKSRLFGVWPLQHSFARVVCVSQAQCDYAVSRLGVPKSRVEFVYDKVDHHFFYPQKVNGQGNDYILTVGQEQRDYDTLLKALAGTGIKLVAVVSSPWSTSRVHVNAPHDDVVVMSRIPFRQLRELYAGARLIVTPLFNVNYAAGVNAVLEAMAMGKPVIVSRTAGIRDYIVDDETGRYVLAENSTELREAILRLWNNPAELKRLGENARQSVDEKMNMDIYVNRLVNIVNDAKKVAEV